MRYKDFTKRVVIGSLVAATVGLFYILLIIYLNPGHIATFDMNSLGEGHLEIISMGLIVLLGLQFYWEECKK